MLSKICWVERSHWDLPEKTHHDVILIIDLSKYHPYNDWIICYSEFVQSALCVLTSEVLSSKSVWGIKKLFFSCNKRKRAKSFSISIDVRWRCHFFGLQIQMGFKCASWISKMRPAASSASCANRHFKCNWIQPLMDRTKGGSNRERMLQLYLHESEFTNVRIRSYNQFQRSSLWSKKHLYERRSI